MNDAREVEDQLRDALRAEAETVTDVAPFGGGTAGEPAGRSRRSQLAPKPAARPARWRMLAAAATAVVVGGVAVATVVRGDDETGLGPGGDAACADEVTFGGATYVPIGEVTRVPVAGKSLGPGTRASCNDGNGAVAETTVAVWAIPGVEPSSAVVLDGGIVYERADRSAAARESALKKYTGQVRCNSAGPTTATGVVTETTATPPTGGLAVGVPYELTIEATGGDVVDPTEYSRVLLSVRVTDETINGRDWSLVSSILQKAVPVSMTLRCAGTQFVVLSLARATSATP